MRKIPVHVILIMNTNLERILICLLKLLRILLSENTDNQDVIRLDPVVDRMPPVDTAAVAEADVINSRSHAHAYRMDRREG